MQLLCTFSPVFFFFFFLRTIRPNHPLTGNLVCSCHMVCLSICWLPSSLSSLVRPQAYYPISHVGSLTFFPLLPCYCSYICPLCLHFLLSPAPLCPVAPSLSINFCVSSGSAVCYPEGSVLHVTESARFDRQGPDLASHPVATKPSATPPSQHHPSTNTHRDRKI